MIHLTTDGDGHGKNLACLFTGSAAEAMDLAVLLNILWAKKRPDVSWEKADRMACVTIKEPGFKE